MVYWQGLFSLVIHGIRDVIRGGGTPYDGLYVEAPPERGIFFRPRVYDRRGISLVEVYKRVGKSVIWVSERAQKGQQMNFMAL